MKAKNILILVIGISAILLTACYHPIDSQAQIQVNNQEISDNLVTVSSITVDNDSWVVIHEDTNGSPGEILGYGLVQQGTTTNLEINIDIQNASTEFYAMLHTDAGTKGVFEFPGTDNPIVDDSGNKVMESFMITGNIIKDDDSMNEDDDMVDDDDTMEEDDDDDAMNDDDDDAMDNDDDDSMEDDDDNLDLSVNSEISLSTNINLGISNFAFTQSSVTITKGSSVTWTNNDAVVHTATADNGLFDSGNLSQGESYKFTFNTPGTYTYHCTPHPNMIGTVIVK